MRSLPLVTVTLVLSGMLFAVPAAAEQPISTVAHRGGAAYAPENTMVAVSNAVRLGVDAIEIDVLFSADGELVVFHDDTLERTTDCEGAVVEHTVAELQECDAAHWFTPGENVTRTDGDGPYPLRGTGVTIPTLSELFAYAAALEAPPVLYVEVKSIPGEDNFDPISRDYAEEVLGLAEAHDLLDHIVVLSFWPAVIDNVKLVDPDVETLLLTTSELGFTAAMNLSYVVARDHDISGPDFRAQDFGAEFVASAHAAGKQVGTWTVNTEEELRAVIDVAPDAIISDFPACLLDLLGRDRPEHVLPEDLVEAGFGLPACAMAVDPGEPEEDGNDVDEDEPAAADDADDEPDDPAPASDLPATGGGAALGVVLLCIAASLRVTMDCSRLR